MKRLPKIKTSSGQALLIILLIMAVALTIGLSVISRSITDIKISQQTEEAARAFSAAEAGIEEALVGTGELFQRTFEETGAKFETKKAGFPPEGTMEFVFPQELTIDDPQTLYLAKYETDGTLTRYYTAGTIDVCWGDNAALEVSIYYQDAGVYKVARAVVDPVNGRTPGSDSPSGQCAGLGHKKTLSLPSGANITLLFLRLRVLYANAKVGAVAASGASFPSQGVEIESTGTAGTSTRKVKVVRFYPAPPVIFDFAIYSGGSLEHQ